MSKWIDGVHHIALTPTVEQYDELVKFYTQLLGLEITRSWGEPPAPLPDDFLRGQFLPGDPPRG